MAEVNPDPQDRFGDLKPEKTFSPALNFPLICFPPFFQVAPDSSLRGRQVQAHQGGQVRDIQVMPQNPSYKSINCDLLLLFLCHNLNFGFFKFLLGICKVPEGVHRRSPRAAGQRGLQGRGGQRGEPAQARPGQRGREVQCDFPRNLNKNV